MGKESHFPLWAKILICVLFGGVLLVLAVITDNDIPFIPDFDFFGDDKKEKPKKKDLDLAEEFLSKGSSEMVDEESSDSIDEESSDTVTD